MQPPAFAELHAPPGWGAVDFISDLHLQPGEPATFAAWRRFMAQSPADAIVILGDLFEAWVGDDAAEAPGFEAECAEVLAAAAARAPVFVMHGNRDFLVGEGLMQRTGARLLHDPTVLAFGSRRWLLTHGDALCIADTDYQAFRAQVRDPAWRAGFLARALEERRTIARGMREHSEARSRMATDHADVDEPTAMQWLSAAQADTLIHGHTHRPADHDMQDGLRRIVLSDWDAARGRMEILRLTNAGAQRLRWQ